MQGRPGFIHHVNDVLWTRGTCGGGGGSRFQSGGVFAGQRALTIK